MYMLAESNGHSWSNKCERNIDGKQKWPATNDHVHKKWLYATLKPLQRFAGQKEKLTDY